MSDIAEFLKARLDEDEAAARTSIGKCPERAEWSYQPWAPGVEGSGDVIAPNDRDSYGYPELITSDAEGLQRAVEERDGPHIARHDPARVLREVTAKRVIIENAKLYSDAEFPDFDGGYASAADDAVRALASAYSDHPDYPTANEEQS